MRFELLQQCIEVLLSDDGVCLKQRQHRHCKCEHKSSLLGISWRSSWLAVVVVTVGDGFASRTIDVLSRAKYCDHYFVGAMID